MILQSVLALTTIVSVNMFKSQTMKAVLTVTGISSILASYLLQQGHFGTNDVTLSDSNRIYYTNIKVQTDGIIKTLSFTANYSPSAHDYKEYNNYVDVIEFNNLWFFRPLNFKHNKNSGYSSYLHEKEERKENM